MSSTKYHRPFKAVVVRVTELDKHAARMALRRQGINPTMRNVAALLREWAASGIAKGG